MTATILYIEDNADNLLLVRRALEARGYRVVEAVDGVDGLAQVEREHPDVVLLDINLPDVDGYEVVRRLRANPAWRTLPVVAITAKALPGDAERALAAGCDLYMSKPIAVRALWATLERLLSTQPKGQAERFGTD
ncbi:MAG: response regulator [Anaerolineales bacterium]|nr:response regulator [Anaerolineales bacterium]